MLNEIVRCFFQTHRRHKTTRVYLNAYQHCDAVASTAFNLSVLVIASAYFKHHGVAKAARLSFNKAGYQPVQLPAELGLPWSSNGL